MMLETNPGASITRALRSNGGLGKSSEELMSDTAFCKSCGLLFHAYYYG